MMPLHFDPAQVPPALYIPFVPFFCNVLDNFYQFCSAAPLLAAPAPGLPIFASSATASNKNKNISTSNLVIYFFSWLTLALILGLIYFFYLDGSKKKGMEYGTEIIKIQILCSFVSCLMAIIG